MGGKQISAKTVRAPSSKAPFDWSRWYQLEEHVAESCQQAAIIHSLRSSLAMLSRRRSWTDVFVGSDTYFAWVESEPFVRVSPDVYLLDDPPIPPPRSWQTWRPGHRPPRWAVEVVSEDWRKDYDDGPAKYHQLGCRELVLFDPDAVGTTLRGERVALTLFRRDAKGALRIAYSGAGPAFSEEIQAWLHVSRLSYFPELRLCDDAAGSALIPTAEEASAQAEADKAKAEADKAQAQADKAQALADKAQAEAETAGLRAQLEASERLRLEAEAQARSKTRRRNPRRS